MMKSRICEMLGIQYPVIQGGMAWVADASLAAAVSSEDIDAGMGIKPAADAMGLDFVEVGVEEYDFAIRKKDLDLPEVKAFIEVLRSDEFHKKLDEIGGYGYHQAGRIVEI